jgi:transcriptional regulator GlxA family with amidase domain
VVRFEQAVLVAHLADMLGYPPHQGSLQFDLDLDVGTGHGRAFVEEVDMVAHRLDQLPGLYSSEYAVRVQEEALMTRLLLAAGHNYRQALASESLPVPSRVVRIAVDVMHSDTDRLHTLASLARAASVSSRTLEREFRTQLHTTPMAYYRTVRIDRARHKLRAADPDLTTVADIARQEGFLNRGRFAAEYRRRYGESPSNADSRAAYSAPV